MMTKILMFAGSVRKDSVNKKLIKAAASIAKNNNISCTVIDLADYDMPLYNGDYEEQNGQPQAAQKLQELIKSHDAILIASPEYNGFFSPLIKNTIDWITRLPEKVFGNKKVAIISASPGALGGIRALPHLRLLLSNIGAIVMPNQLALNNANDAFDAGDEIKEERYNKALESVIKSLG